MNRWKGFDMSRVSIIVPVYNSEKYLEETLNAIAAQTCTDLEVILVDDGSTDRSGHICSERVKTDSRFHYFRVENSGPSVARNAGLSHATGEYIGFCDSDDLIDSNMYQTMIDCMEKNAADIVLCDIYSQRDQRKFGFLWSDGTVFCRDDIRSTVIPAMVGNRSDREKAVPLWGSVVRCLFKRALIARNQITFPTDIHFAEDLVFTLRYLAEASKAVICEKAFYFYRANEESIMYSFYSYKENMFRDRLRLVEYVDAVLKPFEQYDEIRSRFSVTERCYFHECVGNACRKGNGRTQFDVEKELREILNHKEVRRVFRKLEWSNSKTYMFYLLIKLRSYRLIQRYYAVRFR